MINPALAYGTVGTCPAFSCASRAALSPASWVGSSFGTNLPGVVVELDAGLGVGVVAADAESMVAPYKTAPATPPTSIEPATVAAIAVLRIAFTVCLLGFDSLALRPRLAAVAQHTL